MIFDGDNIWIRQSWLDTFMRDPERGRFAIVKPEWDSVGGDTAICGTAAHAAIEATINGFAEDRAIAALRQSAESEMEAGVRWTVYEAPQDIIENAERCFEAWKLGILPRLQSLGLTVGARAEVNFKVPLFTVRDGRTVGITGTVDLVPNAPVLWDWKTSGRKYDAKDKQRNAIQPTIYSLAAILGGLDSEDHPRVAYEWPMDFTYGVMIRHSTKATAQMLTVRRTKAHADFAIQRIRQAVDMALDFGLDRSWPINDDHFLCSERWCPWWSICRGAHAIPDTVPSH